MNTFWTWLMWNANDEPVEFAVIVAFVLGLPVFVAWLVRRGRRTG
jgi:hypothetical protein